MSIIELNNVSKAFKKVQILENVNLNISKGETIGIAGHNGSGKSVLFKLICGLERVDSGYVKLRGKMVGKDFDFPPSVGILINEPGFLEMFSGFENLKFLAGVNNIIKEDIIIDYLKKFGLNDDKDKKVKNYSLGMKKKLAIVQAIMEDQDILIFDEPFNALDSRMMDEVKEVFLELKNQGKTILLTSHHKEDLEFICDKIYTIQDKKMV